MRNDWADIIRRQAPAFGVDPQAALAVAMMEGLSGGVGDNGTSFGPFQLHIGGAMPRHLWGDPKRARAFAESPEGINYALRTMSNAGAKGLKGDAAIEAIVRKFERPADPDREIAGAKARYGKGIAFSGDSSSTKPTPSAGGGTAGNAEQLGRQMLLQTLLGRNRAFARGEEAPAGSGALQMVQQAMLARKLGQSPGGAQTGSQSRTAPSTQGITVSSKPGAFKGSLAEAFYDPLGGYDRQNGKLHSIGAIGGHGNHVHASITNPRAMIQAIKQAQAMGLSARENPYVDPVDPVHTEGSFHGRNFPGTYDGRTLGQGLDVSGDRQKMAAFFNWLRQNFG